MSKRQSQTKPGINIQYPWSRLIAEGRKTVETRNYPLPNKYKGMDFWLIETPGKVGKFKARVIAVIRFKDCKEYKTESDFYADSELHLLEQKSNPFPFKKGKSKFGWIIEKVSVIESENLAPFPRGIVYAAPFTLTFSK